MRLRPLRAPSRAGPAAVLDEEVADASAANTDEMGASDASGSAVRLDPAVDAATEGAEAAETTDNGSDAPRRMSLPPKASAPAPAVAAVSVRGRKPPAAGGTPAALPNAVLAAPAAPVAAGAATSGCIRRGVVFAQVSAFQRPAASSAFATCAGAAMMRAAVPYARPTMPLSPSMSNDCWNPRTQLPPIAATLLATAVRRRAMRRCSSSVRSSLLRRAALYVSATALASE